MGGKLVPFGVGGENCKLKIKDREETEHGWRPQQVRPNCWPLLMHCLFPGFLVFFFLSFFYSVPPFILVSFYSILLILILFFRYLLIFIEVNTCSSVPLSIYLLSDYQ